MSQKKGQQQSIKKHFQRIVKTQEVEVEKEIRLYPLFRRVNEKTTKNESIAIEADHQKQTIPSVSNDKAPTTATKPAIIAEPSAVLRKVKAPFIPRPDPFEKLIKSEKQRFYAKQKQQREALIEAERQHDYIIKKPKKFSMKEIDRKMTLHYNDSWKKDKCCKALFDRLSHINHSDRKVPWVNKYCPHRVEGLMGCVTDHEYLRDWLNMLKLKPAATANDVQRWSKAKKKDKLQPSAMPYRKKRTNDDDTYDMEMMDDSTNELFNLMLLVGNHGVGKSAAVYTAAKEAGYTVFEINATTRRAGKDIAEKIGEMTESHLVRFDAHIKKRKIDRETIIIRDTVKKKKKTLDIAEHFKRLLNVSTQEEDTEENTGKPLEKTEVTVEEDEQGKMQNNNTLKMFFQKAEEKQRELAKTRPKQSLVLLEEVDILYEEDKGFWPAVIDLCQKSKRPIVMTCNETSKIPFDSLNFQEVIFYEIPKRDSIIPYIHLICYSENYVVDPVEIEYLCNMLEYDIRQIINTLQLWLSKSTQQDGYIIFNHLFAHIMGFSDVLYTGDPIVLMDKLKGLDVKTRTLCTQYYFAIRNKRRGRKPTETNIDTICRAMHNLAFADVWIGLTDRQRHQLYDIDQYEIEDIVNGNEVICKRARDLDHWDLSETIENTISILNMNGIKDLTWRDTLLNWPLHYETLKHQSASVSRDSIASLSSFIVDTPYIKTNEKLFMKEYMPTIRSLCEHDEAIISKGRISRSRKNSRYIQLEDENRESLRWKIM
ncbi:P-loop containing nucleoside triphosphate hydrolase protein [Mycotypha africana]|uniref:P-loop containing nucleoside triphosphate hydrolase protein n=1 Tax=Mycotypha africana TaxID=64632 RepID=UPI0023002537|nr:P-loop containing nucleoside triphosphate hydrolase protein [Mycotypha africana]KAI8988518.1 P-loop containing nucleoside triphosphate hydrolase protein [Mycotypha africana]